MPSARIDALGTRIDLTGSDEAVREVADDWSRCLIGDAGGEASTTVSIGERSTPWLASRITREGIEGLAGSHLLFHAAGLADDDGRVLVLVGPSGAGKSTASEHLCRRAFSYVTDETVAIDDGFAITPYPKPLLIRHEPHVAKEVVGPDELGLRPSPPSLAAARIVLLRRDGTPTPSLEPVPMVHAAMALIPETSALARLPRPLQTLFRFIQHCSGAWALHYDEIADAEPLLLSLLRNDTPRHEAWEPIVNTEPASAAEIPGRGSELVVTARVDDAVMAEGDMLLLHGGRPMHLAGIGATLWLAARAGATRDELRAAASAAHGTHADAHRLVDAAIDSMLEHGALVDGTGAG